MTDLSSSLSSLPVSVDRPDVAKREAKLVLTFKEVKESLFKFLMQAGIPFCAGKSLKVFSHIKPHYADDSFYLQTGSFSITCTLTTIKVNKKPIHIWVLPTNYEEVEKRSINKLLLAKKEHNIVVFDRRDCEQVGIDITGKNWLRPLNKVKLKSWARQLFYKIGELGGDIESDITLNTIYENIDKSILSRTGTDILLNRHKEEIKALKRQLKLIDIKKYFSIRDTQLPVLDYTLTLDPVEIPFLEEVLLHIGNTGLTSILFDTAHQVNKNIVSEKICEYLSKNKATWQVKLLQGSVLEVINLKTFQRVYINLLISTSRSIKATTVELKPEVIKQIKSPYLFTLNIQASISGIKKLKFKLLRYQVEFILIDNYSKIFTYPSTYRLPIFDSSLHNKLLLSD